jgi:hypothetical protein
MALRASARAPPRAATAGSDNAERGQNRPPSAATHAQAYSVLFSDQSQQMVGRVDPAFGRLTESPAGGVRLLALSPGTRAEDEYVAALARQKCLDCHGTRGPSQDVSAETLAADGVSCESCHGPAEKWLASHSGIPTGLAGFTAAQKSSDSRLAGMVDLEDVNTRVETCVRCHVGSPAAEVNHDLLAAGHPALKFEFHNYMRQMHKVAHWTPAQDRAQNDSDSDARYWAVGQAETARAAAMLRQARLTRESQLALHHIRRSTGRVARFARR